MTGRFVAKGPLLVRFDLSLLSNKRGESICPRVEFGEYLVVPRQISPLVIAVFFVFPKLYVMSES
jgi:hypothetical protein